MQKIFDSHFHLIDKRFPLLPNKNYISPEFRIDDYMNAVINLDIRGGVAVSGSYHGYEQNHLIDSLKNLGDNFIGVAQLQVNVSDTEIMNLNQYNVRGIRFNLKRLDPICKNGIKILAKRVYELAGWHSEFYVESAQLKSCFDLLSGLPAVSIDHLELTHKGFDLLL